MGWNPIVYCRCCSEPLDVYSDYESRFCSQDCETVVTAHERDDATGTASRTDDRPTTAQRE
jgi:hypothetical protein